MTNSNSIKSVNAAKYDNLDIHTLESVIQKLSAQSPPSKLAQNDLHLARYALSNRQKHLKERVMRLEETNDRYLFFFDSTSGFTRLVGHSVLFFAFTVASRIHWRYSVKLDTDRYFVSEEGTISVRSLDSLASQLTKIHILPDPTRTTSELHAYKLTRIYSDEQIAKLRDQSNRDFNKIVSIALPESPMPVLYDSITQACSLIYQQCEQLPSNFARDTIGRRLANDSYELMIQYLEYANSTSLCPDHNLLQIVRLSQNLRHSLVYAAQLRLIRHREICRILEYLVTIDRIANHAYNRQKSLAKQPA